MRRAGCEGEWKEEITFWEKVGIGCNEEEEVVVEVSAVYCWKNWSVVDIGRGFSKENETDGSAWGLYWWLTSAERKQWILHIIHINLEFKHRLLKWNRMELNTLQVIYINEKPKSSAEQTHTDKTPSRQKPQLHFSEEDILSN